MKAAYIEQTGGYDLIQYGDLPKPEPREGEALVKVGAAAINPIDTYIRSGTVAMEMPQPYILGCDLAGVVESVGAGVKNVRPGMRVWGTNQGLLGRQGTFAEYAAVDERWLYPTSDNVTDETAAACSLVGITAHLGLFRDARLRRGETIFINGGTGGVGSMVVQMAAAIGARAITTCGSDEKCELALQLGAYRAINYKSSDVAAEVRGAAPDGVDVYWETLRNPNFDGAVDLLAERGRMILMAGRTARPPFPVGPFYVKGCSLHGFVMFKATADEQRTAADAINAWLREGKLKARIDRVVPLSEAAAMHRLQEESTVGGSGGTAGKIVLKP